MDGPNFYNDYGTGLSEEQAAGIAFILGKKVNSAIDTLCLTARGIDRGYYLDVLGCCGEPGIDPEGLDRRLVLDLVRMAYVLNQWA